MRWPGFPAVRGLFAGRVIRRAGLNAARPPARREQLGDGGPAAAAGARARAAQDPVQRGHACVPHRIGQRGQAGPGLCPCSRRSATTIASPGEATGSGSARSRAPALVHAHARAGRPSATEAIRSATAAAGPA